MKSPIDFTLLCDGNDGYAVHCPSEEDADLFLEWARRLYPQWCKAWEDGRNNYPQHGTATVYTFIHEKPVAPQRLFNGRCPKSDKKTTSCFNLV